MAAGILNPKDDARATTSRPSESNPGAGSRKWFSDDLATRPRAQDFNRILAQIRSVIDFYSVSDVEGDDTLLRQAIQASATSLSANLTAFSGLTGAANKFPYFTAPGAMDVATVTPFARTLLDDTSASQARLTLGVDAALSDNVVALGNLTSANNLLPYFNGNGSMATTDLTSQARQLLDDTSFAIMRDTLGVEIGTDVQGFSAILDALTGLSPSANRLPYFTGASAMALTDFTAQARQLCDDGSFATMRTTLGLTIGSDVQAWSQILHLIAGVGPLPNGSSGDTGLISLFNISGSDFAAIETIGSEIWALLKATSLGAARNALGLGDLATLDAINNDNWSGADLAVANGGTGSSNATSARTALGLAIGSDVQAFNANLAALSADPFSATSAAFLVGKTGTTSVNGDDGCQLRNDGILTVERAGGVAGHFNRRTSDGGVINFYRQEDNVGSISVTTTATAYNTTSDGRLKDNVAPLAKEVDVGAIIDNLEPVAFDWAGKERGDRGHGFVAQDMHAIVPRAVTPGVGQPGDEDFAPWSADLTKLVPYLVADLQRMHRKLEDIEHTLKGLS